MIHELKCWPNQFDALLCEVKGHEVRKRDRDFRIGDHLDLREWKPTYCERDRDQHGHRALVAKQGEYTGRRILVEVGWITEAGTFGLPADVCVMTVWLVTVMQDKKQGVDHGEVRAVVRA